MFRPSKTTGLAMSCFTRAKSGCRNSFHSVTRKSASARRVIRADAARETRKIEPLGAGGGAQRLHVVGEGRPAIAHAREEEGVPDAPVGAERLADRVHVRADALAEVRHLVHEADAG